eukprot:TRINITY_DN43280_c0_g1_i1.p1 TRINITY_DN43280_c0_g1~~TRINITY_DN43280_c0_g1_i1.p1  ORF type:complete len:382 (+),score=97.18 TRINITY_DN43280_c0_g1_i1:47-1147(+)
MQAAVALAALSGAPSFPAFKQCDGRWGKDVMGVQGPGETSTVCAQGCAMTCVAMALRGYGVELPGGVPVDPGTLNTWLKANSGYKCIGGDCCNLVLDSPDVISAGQARLVGEWGGACCGGAAAKPSLSAVQEGLAAGGDRHMVYVAHVRNRTHFVLLTAWDQSANAFAVNDPGFNQSHYAYADIADVLMYSVLPAAVPKRYPLYKQSDYRWGSDVIEKQTVAEVGCLMSSTSMALAGHGIQIPGSPPQTANPGTLNAWLRAHNGYTPGDDLIESAVAGVDPSRVSWPADAMHTTNDLSVADVQALLGSGRPVIANVMKGRHFVLVVGVVPPSTLMVNDPGFYRVTYDHGSDVVGWRLFNMTNAPSP